MLTFSISIVFLYCFLVQVCVVVFPSIVTILLLFCTSIWWAKGPLQVPYLVVIFVH